MATVAVTDANFEEEVLKSDVPVIVDFWADWCGPCKMIAPHLEAISEELGDQVKIAKMDVDSNQQTPQALRVMSMPTLIAFKDGQPVAQKVGAGSKADLSSWISSAL
ncbi:MAG: thioredoxin [Devosiaceae bacterium]|nr:thioredoxin [Devosiaceae bacterium MH13]